MTRSSIAVVLLSIALAGSAAGCGPGDGAATTATRPTPDRLAVRISHTGGGTLTFRLDCAVADRGACAGVLAALATGDGPSCPPTASDGGRIVVTGTIDGRRVGGVVTRTNRCELRRYALLREALAR